MLKFRNSYEVMQAVAQFLAERGIPFDIEKQSQNSNYIYDIFLPEGLKNAARPLGGKYVSLDLKGPTGVEIKGRLLFDTISRYGDLYSELLKHNEVSSFLLIYIEGKVPTSVYSYIYHKYKGRFHILSLEQFLGIKLPRNTRGPVISEVTYDWRSDRDSTMGHAKVSIAENNFSLFLGAGVSMSANLPSWWNLLKDMIDTCKQKEFKDGDIEKLTKVCYNSSIVMGRFVRMMMEKKSNDEDYYQCLHDALYGGISAYRSPLIDEICNLVDSKKLQAQSIITYNFDDVMERALRERGIENYSVFGQNQPQRFFPIYHVHGFIPYANKDDIKSVPVLSEEEYHRVYASSYNWSNVEQLHALSRTTCIFIGLSMTDPNLRRLLDIAIQDSENDPRHFVFLPRISEFGTDKNAEAKNNEAMKIQKQIFVELGLRVIWYRDYNELPKLLKNLYKLDS
jgi:hypothetical protein